MADQKTSHIMPCGCELIPCTLTGLDDSYSSSNSSNSSDRTVVPSNQQRELVTEPETEQESDFTDAYQRLPERTREDQVTEHDSAAQTSQPEAAGDRYGLERLETTDDICSSGIDIPRPSGAGRSHFPQAAYRDGSLADYDFEAGGSGSWSIQEEDTPAATFGGRASNSKETRQQHGDPFEERPEGYDEAPETSPEPTVHIHRGRRWNQYQAQDPPFAGPSQAALQQHWQHENAQIRYNKILREQVWRFVENAYWKLVLYGYVERGTYHWMYEGPTPLLVDKDFHPSLGEILDCIGHYFTLAFERGADGFRVPGWVWCEMCARAANVEHDARSPRSEW